MKKYLPILLALLLALSLFAACGPKDPSDPNSPDHPETPADGFVISDTTAYTVIVSEFAKDEETAAARVLRNAIEEAYGSKPALKSDWLTGAPSAEEVAARVEVLVGSVDRPECKQARTDLDGVGYTIRAVGNKLIILGANEKLTLEAAEFFAKSILENKPKALEADYMYIQKYEAVLVESKYSDEPIVAEIVATEAPYYADPTGEKDSTFAIQRAIDDCAKRGGGTVYLPVGEYLVTSTVYVSEGVVLHGDWQDPNTTDSPEYGTVILADPIPLEDHERDDLTVKPLINLFSNSGVVGLTFYYPHQNAAEPVSYGYTIHTYSNNTTTIRDITMINAYRGVGASLLKGNGHCVMQLDTLRICALESGVEMDGSRDVGYAVNLCVSPSYWTEASGKYACTDEDTLRDFCRENAVGITIKSLDDEHFSTLRVDGCRTAIHVATPVNGAGYWGLIYDIEIADCTYGIVADSVNNYGGYCITKATIDADQYAIINTCRDGAIKLCGIELTGKGDIVATNGGCIIWDEETDISEYEIDYGDYTKPASKLYIAPIKGLSETKQDVSEQLQATLDEAGKTGGIVYVPAGFYTLTNPITVPAGVQLRGAQDIYTYTYVESEVSGTIFLSYVKEEAAITLEDRAGINGLVVFTPTYTPEDVLDMIENDDALYESVTVKGEGEGVYVLNSTLIGNLVAIDFTDCDNHLIREAFGCSLYVYARVGGANGVTERVMNTFHMIGRNPLADMGCLDTSRCSVSDWKSIHAYEAKAISTLRDSLMRTHYTVIEVVDAENEQVSNVFMFTPACIVRTDHSTATLLNISSDAHGRKPMFDITNGSDVVAVGVLRSAGNSLGVDDSSDFKLYNRVAISDWYEPSFDSTVGDNQNREYDEYDKLMINDGSSTVGVGGVTAYTGSEFAKTGNTSLHNVPTSTTQTQTVYSQSLSSLNASKFMNEDGYLHMWVYVTDMTNIWWTGQISLKSPTGDLIWSTSTTLRYSGWNEIYLPLTGALVQGTFDASRVSAVHMTNMVVSTIDHPEFYIDDVYLTLARIDQNALPIEQTEVEKFSPTSPSREGAAPNPVDELEIVDGKLMMFDCNTASGDQLLSTNPDYVKEGNGSWRVRGAKQIALTLTFEPIDISSFMKDGYLHMWMYIDGNAWINDGQIELSSSGTCDVQEISWNAGTYISSKEGWCELKLPLSTAYSKDGSFDPTSLNYMRIYFFTNKGVVPDVYIDDIYFKDDTPEPIVEELLEGLYTQSFTVGATDESRYLTDHKASFDAKNQRRFADKVNQIVYKYSVKQPEKLSRLTWRALIGQQLVLQVSTNNADWVDLYRYDGPEGDTGIAMKKYSFDLLEALGDQLTGKRKSVYIRIADASTSTGYGGAVQGEVVLEAYYGDEANPPAVVGPDQGGAPDTPVTPDIPDTPNEPELPDEPMTNEPEGTTIISFTVDNGESETPYLTDKKASFNASVQRRFADKTNEFIYKYNITAATNLVELSWSATTGQQLVVQASLDGASWVDLYRYDGDEAHGLPMQVRSYNVLEAIGARLTSKYTTLYIRIADASTDNGWGGAVQGTVELRLVYGEKQELTAKRTEYVFVPNTSAEVRYLTTAIGHIQPNNPHARYADKTNQIIYAFSVAEWQTLSELTFSATIGQQLLLAVSVDQQNWITVYAYEGDPNDSGLPYEHREYDLLAPIKNALLGMSGEGKLYVKIADSYTETGYGGGVKTNAPVTLVLDYNTAQ